MTTDKQALREVAEKAGKDKWQARKINGDFFVIRHGSYEKQSGITSYQPVAEIDDKAVRDFVAMANPAAVLALLDENIQLWREKDATEAVLSAMRDDMRQTREQLKAAEHTAAVDHEAACSLVEENEELKRKLETAEKQIVVLSSAANVNNQWKPEVCPVTGRQFFMWIEHPALGYVPTYGGPFDSYTIPTRDNDGEFSCERYDHDFGGWREGECIGVYLTDDDEQCRVHELEQHIAELESKNGNLRTIAHEQNELAIRANLDSINDAAEMDGLQKRIAELEAREILLPERSSMLHRTDFHEDYHTVIAYKVSDAIAAIRAAGIKVKGE
ncbi:ead/Ea22-like family protein [Salmonella enterica subsp. enterica serovar Hvittingfoss]|nr:ead/Ea22-like family protein [Salmonella enterica subsp. enterica serovar Hvittingfoss]EEE1293567.1 ead/Ea22-like family protein [Salmonella enterica subsp. diarizonae]EGF6523096.1 ead/Ea22-like family protein [Salmonella enterica]EHL2771238.1 ead/Ea22-like family protein [Salmonella enterica subsp. enterica serovar Hvittingfoss]EHL2850803.1 ead/Ea22-like family protein [Salmonella enterica subsp. enterica serovar Hvittingfoss]